MQLARYLCKFERVLYNTMEEGLSLTIQNAIVDTGFADCKSRFFLLDNETIDDLVVRLKKQRSPNVIFIDSLQYSGLDYERYKTLKEMFPRKLFIFISHAKGSEPKDAIGMSVQYDANVKIRVAGYIATAKSRFGGKKEYVVWKEGVRNAELKNQ